MLSGRVWLCGDGAGLFYGVSKDRTREGTDLRLAPETARDQNALSVALCGWRMHLEGKTVPGKDLRPVYLRMPQAERERLERESGN